MAIPITQEQYELILKTMNEDHHGFFRKNYRCSLVLMCEATCGLRVGDVLKLTLNHFSFGPKGCYMRIIEQKTGKTRSVPVPAELFALLQGFALSQNRRHDEPIFGHLTVRAVDKTLRAVCDFLELDKRISTHSFRKLFAHNIHERSNHNLVLVQEALLHSSINTTRMYLGVASSELSDILTSNFMPVKLN